MISTATSSLVFLGTNVLVYGIDVESEFHSVARPILTAMTGRPPRFCIAPQVLAELFAVITSARRVRTPRSTADARLLIESLLPNTSVILIPTPADVVLRWLNLAARYTLWTGQRIFDLQLVATMLGNGVQKLCTFNRVDFESIAEIELVSPESAQVQ